MRGFWLVAVMISGCETLPAVAAPAPLGPISISIDATDATRARFVSHMTIPAREGTLDLVAPKWIPGEHSPTGPFVNTTKLVFKSGASTLDWKRDGVDMHMIHVAVPKGATQVDVELEHTAAPLPHPFSGASTNSQLLQLAWDRVSLVPKGIAAAQITMKPSVVLPKGWKQGSALVAEHTEGDRVDFKSVSFETLVDSPVIAGAHFASYDLGVQNGAKHELHVVSDSDEGAKVPNEILEHYRKLVAEANALFGARHYDAYHFLVVTSDAIPSAGVEHHQSSYDTVQERFHLDDDVRRGNSDLLAHEMVHSWNGKYRRPRGLLSPTFQEPMRGELLWVYEGLTQYLGWVLAVRSGFAAPDDFKSALALISGQMNSAGRKWRPLSDTGTDAQDLYSAPQAGYDGRRGVDFYNEGVLIWLEADVLIRQKTNGAKSLDDFCKRFHGGASTSAEVRPYDVDEVTKTLNEIAPNDWKEFFKKRVEQVSPVPVGGIEGGGYRVGWSQKKSDYLGALEKDWKFTSYDSTFGFSTNAENVVADVSSGTPSHKAGLGFGMKIIGIDGRKVSPELVKDAMTRAKTSKDPIALLVEDGSFYKTISIDYHEGERYRSLERDESKPDLISKIVAPITK